MPKVLVGFRPNTASSLGPKLVAPVVLRPAAPCSARRPTFRANWLRRRELEASSRSTGEVVVARFSLPSSTEEKAGRRSRKERSPFRRSRSTCVGCEVWERASPAGRPAGAEPAVGAPSVPWRELLCQSPDQKTTELRPSAIFQKGVGIDAAMPSSASTDPSCAIPFHF